uniref:hypothetical protein n=1 Tax=Streptococcus agalactiae TaxID=1311 RepID=UPI001F5538B8
MGVKSNEELKREQYLAEFSRVVTNFKWNASRIYFGDIIAIKLCFKEALKQIDILHERAILRRDEVGQAYNVANEDQPIMIKDLAQKL